MLSAAELQPLLKALDKEPLFVTVPVHIALHTGMRLGEICALEWASVDLEKRQLTVHQVRQRLAGGVEIVREPKTEGSYRTIPFSEGLQSILRLWQSQQRRNQMLFGPDYHLTDFVLAREDGQLAKPHYYSEWFVKFMKRNGLKKVTMHGLRHTYATLLLHSQAIPTYAISENLGHADKTMLMRVYGHEVADSNRKAADYLDQLIAIERSK